MDSRLAFLLTGLNKAEPGIWRMETRSDDQAGELAVRNAVAESALDFDRSEQYWSVIQQHHSVPVMQFLLDRWLQTLPADALVLDVGPGWGWHWVNALRKHRGICVAAVDFSTQSLQVAKRFLPSDLIGRIAFIQGNATSLDFSEGTFDGYWSVQCLQHVPDFEKAVKEAYRVLRPGGGFVNWSLNNSWLVAATYSILGKHYHRRGRSESWGFELNRWSQEQREIVQKVFDSQVHSFCSEVLFQPDFRASRFAHSALGARLDVAFSQEVWGSFFAPVARQRSLAARKLK